MKRSLMIIAAATTVAALATGLGAATTDESTPVAGWLEQPRIGGNVTGEPTLLRVDGRETAWSVAAYVSDQGLICFAAGPAGERKQVPSGGASCFGGLPLAAGMVAEGPVRPTFGSLDAAYRTRNVVYGVVASRATHVKFLLGGKRLSATLASETLTVPVRATGRLSKMGKRLLARLPKTVDVRAFALAFDDKLGTRDVTVETKLADGKVYRQKVAGAPQSFRK